MSTEEETGSEEEFSQIQGEVEPSDEELRPASLQLRKLRDQNTNPEGENPEEILERPGQEQDQGFPLDLDQLEEEDNRP